MLEYRRTVLLLGLLLATSVLACTIDLGAGEASKPVLEILSPPSGSRVEKGEEVEVRYRASDAVAVVSVELEADGGTVAVDRSPTSDGVESMAGILRWTATTPGTHTLVLYARSRAGAVSDPVGVSIIVAEPPATSTSVPPTPTHAPAPPTPSHTPAPPTPTHTVAPPTPTPTSTARPTQPPPSPTATSPPPSPTARSIDCPTITIRQPSMAPAKGPFGIEFDRQPGKPGGYMWVVEFRQPPAPWTRAEPIPANVTKRGQYWMAEVRAPGEGEWHWRICLTPNNQPYAPGVCCSTRKVINHVVGG